MIGPKLRRFMALCPALFRGQPAPGEVPSVASHLVAIAVELEQERLDALKAAGVTVAKTRTAMHLHVGCYFVGGEERLPDDVSFDWSYRWDEFESSEPERPSRKDVVEHGVRVAVSVDGSDQFVWLGTCETWWGDNASFEHIDGGETAPGYSGGQPTRGGFRPMSWERLRGEAAGRSALLLALRAFEQGPTAALPESSRPPMPGEFEAMERAVDIIRGFLAKVTNTEELLTALREVLK